MLCKYFLFKLQIKAALLLSSKGQEAPAVSDRIKSLSAAPDSANTLVGVKCDTDIKGLSL